MSTRTFTNHIIINNQLLTPASSVRGSFNTSAGNIDGGFLTLRIANGTVAPTAQCVCIVYVAHGLATMPASGGDDVGIGAWKELFRFGGGTVANAVTRRFFDFGAELPFIQVEFSENTGQSVTVEAFGTLYHVS